MLNLVLASFSARREDHFQKKLSKTDLYLFLAEKTWSFVLFVCFVLFNCFVCCNTLSDFGILFFKTLFKGKNFAVRRVREG